MSGLGQMPDADRLLRSRGTCARRRSRSRGRSVRGPRRATPCARSGWTLPCSGEHDGVAPSESALAIDGDADADDIGRAYVNLAEAMDDCGERWRDHRHHPRGHPGRRGARDPPLVRPLHPGGGVAFDTPSGGGPTPASWRRSIARGHRAGGPSLSAREQPAARRGRAAFDEADAGLARAFDSSSHVRVRSSSARSMAAAERELWRHDRRRRAGERGSKVGLLRGPGSRRAALPDRRLGGRRICGEAAEDGRRRRSRRTNRRPAWPSGWTAGGSRGPGGGPSGPSNGCAAEATRARGERTRQRGVPRPRLEPTIDPTSRPSPAGVRPRLPCRGDRRRGRRAPGRLRAAHASAPGRSSRCVGALARRARLPLGAGRRRARAGRDEDPSGSRRANARSWRCSRKAGRTGRSPRTCSSARARPASTSRTSSASSASTNRGGSSGHRFSAPARSCRSRGGRVRLVMLV